MDLRKLVESKLFVESDADDIRAKRASIKANLNKISSDQGYSFYNKDGWKDTYFYNGRSDGDKTIKLKYNSDSDTWSADGSRYTDTQVAQFIKDNGFFRHNKNDWKYEPASDKYVKMAKSNPGYKVYTKVPAVVTKSNPSQAMPLPSEERQVEINNTLRDKMITLRDKTIESAKDKYRKLSKELEDRVLNGETSGNWERYERPMEHIKELISRLKNTEGANDVGKLIPEQDEIKYRNTKDAMKAWNEFNDCIDYELGYINFGE